MEARIGVRFPIPSEQEGGSTAKEQTMENLSTFQREFLWELEIPRKQVTAIAEAVPEEAYDWRPAEDARTFSAVLVHIAAGNLMLLFRADVVSPEVMRLCGSLEGDGIAQWLALVRKSFDLERTVTRKEAVLELVKNSFDAVQEAIKRADPEQLERTRDLFGELTTYRRVFLRILAHADEHMGQAIAYARTMGFHAPWPDPLKSMEEMVANTAAG
jgi:uncharacterized damage-inducible protein DinB